MELVVAEVAGLRRATCGLVFCFMLAWSGMQNVYVVLCVLAISASILQDYSAKVTAITLYQVAALFDLFRDIHHSGDFGRVLFSNHNSQTWNDSETRFRRNFQRKLRSSWNYRMNGISSIAKPSTNAIHGGEQGGIPLRRIH